MKIWVDADACPKEIKEILYRAADRTGLGLTLVANHQLRIPKSPNICFILVKSGFDVADAEIATQINTGDLVITSDIPLAAKVIEMGAYAISTRGEHYSVDNIRARLSVRDFMDNLRASGVNTGGPSALNQRDCQSFANNLDKILTKHLRMQDSS